MFHATTDIAKIASTKTKELFMCIKLFPSRRISILSYKEYRTIISNTKEVILLNAIKNDSSKEALSLRESKIVRYINANSFGLI